MEAVWYALVAALTFIGFVSIVFYIMLKIYNPKQNGKYIINIPENADESEISFLFYAANLRSMLFGNLIFDSITVVSFSQSSSVTEFAAEYSNINVITESEMIISGKDENGNGTC